MSITPTVPDLADARNELHDARPPDRFVGRAAYVEGRRVWEQYAFDRTERPKAGHRPRDSTAVAATELEVMRELARCLRLIRDDRVP